MKLKFLSFLFAFVLTLAIASCSSNTPTGDIDKDVATLVDKLRDVSGEDDLNNYITIYKQYLDYYDNQGNKRDFILALDNATIEDPNLKTKMFKVFSTVATEESKNNPTTVESVANKVTAAVQEAAASEQVASAGEQSKPESQQAAAPSEPATCSKCGGSGKVKCSKCGGKGYKSSSGGGTVPERYGCKSCGGRGLDYFDTEYRGWAGDMKKGSGKMKCPKCHGSGKE